MNQLLKGMLFLSAACLLVASSLQAADHRLGLRRRSIMISTIPPIGLATSPRARPTTARVLVTTNFPVISSVPPSTCNDLLYWSLTYQALFATTPGEVDMTGGTSTVTTTFRVGGAVGDSYLKISGGTFTKVCRRQ